MNRDNEYIHSDREWLEQARTILANKGNDVSEESLNDFCVLLAHAAPQASRTFRRHLEILLLAKWKEQLGGERAPTHVSSPVHVEQAGGFEPTPRWQLLFKPAMGWVGIGVLLAILFMTFPALHTAAAQVTIEVQQIVRTLLISGHDNSLALEPVSPPFTIRQPDYLPEGFSRTRVSYHPGNDAQIGWKIPGIELRRVQPSSQGETAAEENRLQFNGSDSPFIVFEYTASNGQYIHLLQRAVQVKETLPPGQRRVLNHQSAVLQPQDDGALKLTWIDGDTWIELTGTVPESELLTIAKSLMRIQSANSTTDSDNPALKAAYCASVRSIPSDGRLLGNINGQQYKGSVRIRLMDETYPISAIVGLGSNAVNVNSELLLPALAALQDPTLPIERLSYPSLGFQYSETEGCLQPDPAEQGYVVIEVWEDQVKLGYGGKSKLLKERAIQALRRELEKVR